MLHYINVSTPFNVTGDHLMVERPKVLQCLETDRVSQEESLRNKLERDVANAKFVEDASQEELTAKQQNQLAEENWLQYITIQGFDVLDFIIPQQKKLVGIRELEARTSSHTKNDDDANDDDAHDTQVRAYRGAVRRGLALQVRHRALEAEAEETLL